MPIYEYECLEHGRFEVRQSMDNGHKADCPECGKPAEPRISACSVRFAEPLTVYQDLGGHGNRHKGYQQIDWKPDSGISPKPGQPYKTAKEIAREG